MADTKPTDGVVLSSMTGFARLDGETDGVRWVWEMRSVNARGLELRFRLPHGFDALDPVLRKTAGEMLKRGSVNATLSVVDSNQTAAFRVNDQALTTAIDAVKAIGKRLECAPPQPEGILALRGVIDTDDDRAVDDERTKKLHHAIADGFRNALTELRAARASEGASLAGAIIDQIDEIEALTKKAQASAEPSLKALRDRLDAQITELLAKAELDENRLAQEASLLAVKADIREELDRLVVHAASAREIIATGGAVGRKLDFLTQEFNREANTLCAKAPDMTLKQIGLDLKAVIDQLREQIQNIE